MLLPLLISVVLTVALIFMAIRMQSLLKELELLKQNATPPVDNEAEERKKSLLRHDLKGTLNRIFALSKLIPMSGPLNESQQEYLAKIEAQCTEGQEEINRAIPKRN